MNAAAVSIRLVKKCSVPGYKSWHTQNYWGTRTALWISMILLIYHYFNNKAEPKSESLLDWSVSAWCDHLGRWEGHSVYWARRTFALWLQWQVSSMHAPAYTDTHLCIIVPSLCWMSASMVTLWFCASPHTTLLEKIVPSPAFLLHAFISSCRITNGLPCLVGGFCSSRFPYNLFQRTVVDFPKPNCIL